MKEIIPPAPDSLRTHTYDVLIDLWMENFAENMKAVRTGKDLKELPKKTGEPVIVVGGGPSLKRNKHLAQIAKAKWKHNVFCCDKKIKSCLKHKIIPYVVSSIDGNPIIQSFYNHNIVRKHAKEINAVFNAYVHPSTVKAWKGSIYWFTNILGEVENEDGTPNRRSIAYLMYLLTGRKSLISTLGNVGAFLLHLGFVLKCDPIILTGIDFSEQVKDKSEAVYFHGLAEMYEQKYGKQKAMDMSADLHQVEHNPDFDNYYLVNPIWKAYRDLLGNFICETGAHVIQSSGFGCLHTEAVKCGNFEAMPLKKVLSTYN